LFEVEVYFWVLLGAFVTFFFYYLKGDDWFVSCLVFDGAYDAAVVVCWLAWLFITG
jgi:hypothetical protein